MSSNLDRDPAAGPAPDASNARGRRRRRVIVGLVGMLVVIALISATLGRVILADRQPGLWSFSLVHFAGYLFFLLMPVEALVPIYQAEGHLGSILVGLAVSTALTAQLIDYGIGHLVSDQIINDLIGPARYRRARRAIDRYGSGAILLFNLLPLSSPNLLLAAGMMRFPPLRAFGISAIGLSLKYLAMIYVFGAMTGD